MELKDNTVIPVKLSDDPCDGCRFEEKPYCPHCPHSPCTKLDEEFISVVQDEEFISVVQDKD